MATLAGAWATGPVGLTGVPPTGVMDEAIKLDGWAGVLPTKVAVVAGAEPTALAGPTGAPAVTGAGTPLVAVGATALSGVL